MTLVILEADQMEIRLHGTDIIGIEDVVRPAIRKYSPYVFATVKVHHNYKKGAYHQPIRSLTFLLMTPL